MLRLSQYSISLLLLAGFLFATQATASTYTKTLMDKSNIQFSGAQNGDTAFTGTFSSFEVEANFDSSDLEQSYINVVIDLASAHSGSEKRDSMLKKSNWFDTENTPRSYFKSNSIRALSGDKYEVEGMLEIKGISKPYRFNLEIRELVDLLKMSGEFTINRLDFDLGLGAWKNPDWVRHEVEVKFDIAVKSS